MSAASIILDALARADRYDAKSYTTIVRVLLATSQLRNALAPRIGADCPLTEEMFNIVAVAPTAWCAAHIRLLSPTAAVLQQTLTVFVQLRSISVHNAFVAADMAALTAMPASLNQLTLRDLEFGSEIAVTDGMLRDGFATVTARLETLIIACGGDVTDAGLASLRGTPMIATLRKFSLTGARRITDDGVAALLGPASELRSLSFISCTLLSGAFLTQLHEHCHDSLAEIDLSVCASIDNAGAAALCSFRGLTELDLSHAAHLSVLVLERLPLLRAVKTGFLTRCSALKTLDLSALANVHDLGDFFLDRCSCLTTLDLSPLASVTRVGDYFMRECCSLKSLDLSAMINVLHVGRGFLFHCNSLMTLDLSGLTSLSSVSRDFLTNCSDLTTLDMSGLTNVHDLGDGFLAGCRSLTTLDLSKLMHVARVGRGFLYDCGGLKSLRLSVTLLLHGAVLDEHKQLHARSSAAAARAVAC